MRIIRRFVRDAERRWNGEQGGGHRLLLVVSAAAIVSVASLIVVYDLNGQSLDLSDRELRLVVTGSMDAGETGFPVSTIPENSIIMVHRLDREDLPSLEVGDVIAYSSGSMMIMHRVVELDPAGERFVVKGDANASAETVSYDQVVGEVVGVNHALGSIVFLVKTQFVLMLAAVACIIVIALSLREIHQNYSKEEDN